MKMSKLFTTYADTIATSCKKKKKRAWMSQSGVCAHINTGQCRGRRAKESDGGGKKRGGASNLQGLASNTIWRETIQFAGTGGGKEEEEGGGKGTDEGQGQKSQQQVRGHRQRMKPASGVHSERVTSPEIFLHWIKGDYVSMVVWKQKSIKIFTLRALWGN